MKTNFTLKSTILAIAMALAFYSCKKGGDIKESEDVRQEQQSEIMRRQAILDQLNQKTYSLVVIKNVNTGENLMASTMFPACIADDTFTLSEKSIIDFNYSSSLCAGTSSTFRGTYNFKSATTDSIKFNGMDEAPAYKTKGVVKQDVFVVKTFDETNKTMVLSYRLSNGNEIIRQYSYK